MKENKTENNKKAIEISLPEESWERLQALANGQQKQLESVVAEAVTAYIRQQARPEESQDDKINPIEDTEPAKSWGYNSDVRGK